MQSRRGSGASATLVRPASPGRDRRPGPNLPLSPPTDRAGTHYRDRLACSFGPSGTPPSLQHRPNVDPAHQPHLCARPAPGRDRRPGPNLPLSPPADRAGTHCRGRLACNFDPSGPPPSLPCSHAVDPAHQPRLCARPAPDGTDAPDRTYPHHPPPTAPTPTAETGWLVISSRAGHYHPCDAVAPSIRRISHAGAPGRPRTGPTPRTELASVTPHRQRRHPLPRPVGL